MVVGVSLAVTAVGFSPRSWGVVCAGKRAGRHSLRSHRRYRRCPGWTPECDVDPLTRRLPGTRRCAESDVRDGHSWRLGRGHTRLRGDSSRHRRCVRASMYRVERGRTGARLVGDRDRWCRFGPKPRAGDQACIWTTGSRLTADPLSTTHCPYEVFVAFDVVAFGP
jgi:hypothetical protein